MVAKIGLSKKNGIGMLFNWQRRIRKDADRRETGSPSRRMLTKRDSKAPDSEGGRYKIKPGHLKVAATLVSRRGGRGRA